VLFGQPIFKALAAMILLMVQKSQGQPPDMYKNPVNNGINYHINWLYSRISEPSTVSRSRGVAIVFYWGVEGWVAVVEMLLGCPSQDATLANRGVCWDPQS